MVGAKLKIFLHSYIQNDSMKYCTKLNFLQNNTFLVHKNQSMAFLYYTFTKVYRLL